MVDSADRHKQICGMVATSAAFCIFGVKMVFTKDLTNSGLFSPMALVAFRLIGATVLFWIMSVCVGKEEVEKKDILVLIPAALIQIVLAQISSIYATVYSTPFDSSMVVTLKPVFTLILAAMILKTRFSFSNIFGIILGMVGVYLLAEAARMPELERMGSRPIGIFLAVLNSLCSAVYLVCFRGIILKYSPLTITKWLFLIATLTLCPFLIPNILSVRYEAMDYRIWLELGFVVVFSTFLTYFLTAVGHKYLKPVTYSVFTYFQPLVAAFLGMLMGLEIFSLKKGLAAMLMVAAVILVNKNKNQ